ncbi:antibiotic biosynthesis monooxygenase family protein [Thalassotalea sp. G2M2-11]|uniref:putative quinol monooxygenase n=1 Tax=Thalassotalea sp. G2M2-11 TaxID=2787627 RepID=UPI001F493CB0|nr:antibiotic biosynthesis monooxygenase family protein [Thalassotalea sp. G2M2-11]
MLKNLKDVNAMTITRINHFHAAQGKAEALDEFLHSLVPYITASEGCLSCQVLRNEEKTDQFAVIEQWQSKDHHQQSLANFPKEDMAAAMPLFAMPPEGGYFS